ncbi:hypothetical protein BVZ84_01402 [Haemophilus influenzae]|nr:hypothetical protein BV205_00958 [Haemophilus influenzae]PRK24829.1 hypothetical protein BV206_01113 [Haemophilus influenzae]PRK99058.1 hypothetical protein BV137_00051 [Haemophilus influenzae]PRK99764.1 hypothetical protein BV136_01246 [Haemophilus influenzae]PRL60619.1 hypothetical protein BV070_00622 [Haemophilus influenzae]
MANQNTFKQAPLPFIGQKRMFLKHFETVLNENIKGDGEGWTVIDTFGGSGLLSHAAKRLKPKARVIYNDFDGYDWHISTTLTPYAHKSLQKLVTLRQRISVYQSH